MNRRRFIQISFLTGVGVIIAGIIKYYDFETVLFKILKKDLKTQDIDVSESVIKKYIEETRAYRYWDKIYFTSKKKAFVIFYFFLPNMNLPYQFKYNQAKARLVGDFLLSTDFFINKMDTKRKIKYIGLYDPYLRPCANPFSNLYYPPSV
jgi:hypothetical protein